VNRFFYTAFIRLLSPALLSWMAIRARRAGGDWQVFSGPRFGHYPRTASMTAPVWVHAVSLGETRAAAPFVQALLDQGECVLLTHMTVTGRAEGGRLFAPYIEQGRLQQEWLPYDFPGSAGRFMAHYRPCIGVLIEREVWPNLIAAARRNHIPLMLVSARFSDRALRQSLRAGRVMRQAYGSLEGVYAQTLHDAQHLEQAGASDVRVSGNFKFDISLPADKVARGRALALALRRKVVVIASTREGEDVLFIRAIGRQLKRARARGDDQIEQVLFCLIPRHPRRFDEAAALLTRSGLSFVRRSKLIDIGEGSASAVDACSNVQVLLGDSMGEMAWYYGMGHVAIVAGSFEPLGGQNLIEACAVGVPVVVGPHTKNFEQAVVDAIDEGAAIRVQDADLAVQAAMQLIDDPQRLTRMGQAGVYWVQQHTGAVARVVAGLNELKAELQLRTS
jgi:3-deoxy-D-manno-octulosonic-acid transferase